MMRGLSQRIAVAVALMGVLLLSVGTCVPAQAAMHCCCQHMRMMSCAPSSANCCTTSPQAPTAMVASEFSGLDAAILVQAFVPVNERSASRFGEIVAGSAAQSPPLKIFNLRI